jgi:hypothetical protein
MNSEEDKKPEAESNDAVDEPGPDSVEITEEETVEKKMEPLDLNFDHYLSGGSIGFSVAILLMLALEWVLIESGLESSLIARIFLSFAPSLIGGTVGSFLFIRRTRKKHFEDGLKMGVSGLIITMLYTMILGVNVGGFYIIMGFLGGGLLGGYISKQIYE